MMRLRGVHYDVGHEYASEPGYGPGTSRPHLDLASFGLVKVIEDPSAGGQEVVLEPKEAFWALAAAYGQSDGR